VPTAVVIYGPKAVGKSVIAQILTDHLGVYHVDTDALVLRALAQGVEPDPVVGWLEPVMDRVRHALEDHDVVSVEATGAWDSDWQLARDLEDLGIDVLRIWVTAPPLIAMRRLINRKIQRAPVTTEEAAEIHDRAVARAEQEEFDMSVDTTSPPDPVRVAETVQHLLTR
jgi:predicted kinase